jgi:hypothetical protein
MGLPTLTLEGNLLIGWTRTLEANGLAMQQEKVKEQVVQRDLRLQRVTEILWQASDGVAQVQILEVTTENQERRIHIIFMPLKTKMERQLYLRIWGILVAEGAIVGVRTEKRRHKSVEKGGEEKGGRSHY